ncbi:hypothetical protein E3O42_16190 [Cryobacterium adonitolivorans]|uniref:Replication-associated protein ORF2/G2P domain-containing protein n=1 Tax=Cryobacterium adonitolivorans TaxID=1259189 RepID=A0A4R8W239_9MICO|nr:hypothetical protein E3O42_16190 [Cryobacterium adonitolivorans]
MSSLARPDSGWQFSLYPAAGEGGGSFRGSVRRASSFVPAGKATNPERSLEEAGRRARSKLRRYCAANRLNRLGTLTYRGEGCHDPNQVREDLGQFFRNLRAEVGPLPYAWVPEWHPGGHGLHAHFAVGQFVKRQLIDKAWGHGFVHIKLIGDLPVGSGSLSESRIAASYLAKYVSKTFLGAQSVLGMHRYDVAQGFQPKAVALVGKSAQDVINQASSAMGSYPATEWLSRSEPTWEGPPVVWAQWGR